MPDIDLIIIWLAAIVGAYVFLFWIAPWWARRTPNDLDDVVVGVLQRPLLFCLCLWALTSLADHVAPLAGTLETLHRAINILLIGAITWSIWRLVRATVLYYGRRLARRTEANFDDVLIPVLDILAPVVILGTGAILMLRRLGADITTMVLTTGASAVIIGLALGDMIKNILGGLILLIDTPFRFGDLIVWDGAVCQIKQIGLRVTTLYNTEDHSDVFLPNSLLASAKLTNITRPSPDLRMPVDVEIADAGHIPQAKAILLEMAESNPYVLGDVAHKLDVTKRALAAVGRNGVRARELRWGLMALRHELNVDRYLAEIDRLLGMLYNTVHGAEKGGLTATELADISEQLNAFDAYDDKLVTAVRLWARARTVDPQLEAYPGDRERLLADAEARLLAYQGRLAELRRHLKDPNLFDAQRIDDLIVELRDWLPQMFKLITPAWKYPFVAVVHAGAGGAALRLYVYVDDIHLERFMRRQRVVTALREAACERLRGL